MVEEVAMAVKFQCCGGQRDAFNVHSGGPRTGVSEAARHAGNSADATAMMESAAKAIALVVMLTGRPGNISGIFTSLSMLERPNATLHPTVPLTNARTQPSARKSIMMRCARGAQSLAQSDFERPLEDTVTSMMFMTPMPPSEIVTKPLDERKEHGRIVVEDPVGHFLVFDGILTGTALLSAGSNPWTRADGPHHLFARLFELPGRTRLHRMSLRVGRDRTL